MRVLRVVAVAVLCYIIILIFIDYSAPDTVLSSDRIDDFKAVKPVSIEGDIIYNASVDSYLYLPKDARILHLYGDLKASGNVVYGRGTVAYAVDKELVLYRGESVKFIGQLKIWDASRRISEAVLIGVLLSAIMFIILYHPDELEAKGK